MEITVGGVILNRRSSAGRISGRKKQYRKKEYAHEEKSYKNKRQSDCVG